MEYKFTSNLLGVYLAASDVYFIGIPFPITSSTPLWCWPFFIYFLAGFASTCSAKKKKKKKKRIYFQKLTYPDFSHESCLRRHSFTYLLNFKISRSGRIKEILKQKLKTSVLQALPRFIWSLQPWHKNDESTIFTDLVHVVSRKRLIVVLSFCISGIFN